MEYLRKIIDISIEDPESLEFSSTEELKEFLRAVGYAVMYGSLPANLPQGNHPKLQVTQLRVEKDRTLMSSTFKTISSWSCDAALSSAIDQVIYFPDNNVPFVMGGILSDGKYSFHS